MSRFRRGGIAGYIATFVAGMAFAAGLGASAGPESADPAPRFAKLDVFAEALSYIENNYVDPVDERALIYGAVGGMVTALDPYSKFLAPERYRRLREETEGAYGGVGVALDRSGGALVVTDVLPGSPAARAGIAVGDRIVAVNGAVPTRERAGLRGPAGTRVVVRITRPGWAAPRELALVRERVRLRAVESAWLSSRIFYLRIRQFQHATAAEARRAVERALAQGELAGLILDVRSNPGGLFDEAVKVVDLFLSDGGIVTVRGRLGRALEQHRAHAPGTLPAFPMAVLIDANSASSAEIVAGALQDRGRAVLVGETSFGKGSVQSFLDLVDGSGLKLTTARYVTPGGRSIQNVGIEPDLEVESAPAERSLRDDPQVRKAAAALLGPQSSLSNPLTPAPLP